MPDRRLLYYITDRTAFAADELTRRQRLLEKIAEAARAGVDYIQLREKDMPTRELESLARDAVRVMNKVRAENRELSTALLINSRTDIAVAVAAEGIHLRAGDISPQEVRKIWKYVSGAGTPGRDPQIGISCHSAEAVHKAAGTGATFAVFAPVFEKKDSPARTPAGLKQLEKACRASIPVLALGGITIQNAESCLTAGAAGIAAIRLFQEHPVADVVGRLRRL
jgi:thiamine-phosphate pyrophosphorylase